METLAIILSPLVEVLRLALDGLHAVTGSYGLSIVLLSTIVRVLMIPVSRRAARAEERHEALQLSMAPALAAIKAGSKGRERFEKTEALYQEHGYHPIHSMASLLPLLLQIPFLLAALFLLTTHEGLRGTGFLIIADLGQPDRLVPSPFGTANINLLPLLLTGIAITEALIKRTATASSRAKFVVVALVIVVLIYPLAAAVCLYWLTSNVWSLLSELKGRVLGKPRAPSRSEGSIDE